MSPPTCADLTRLATDSMRAMHLRRSLALLSGAIMLAAPLSSCGFDPATNQVNTIAAGANDRDSSVDVLGAVVVSSEPGSGTFIASFVNNSETEPASVDGMDSEGEATVETVDFPVEIEPGSIVNLALDDQGVAVEGEFEAGDVVPLTVQLGSGDTIELDVPVVPNCREWEGLDGPVGTDCEVAEPVGDHG
jgi:hypothetical protein